MPDVQEEIKLIVNFVKKVYTALIIIMPDCYYVAEEVRHNNVYQLRHSNRLLLSFLPPRLLKCNNWYTLVGTYGTCHAPSSYVVVNVCLQWSLNKNTTQC